MDYSGHTISQIEQPLPNRLSQVVVAYRYHGITDALLEERGQHLIRTKPGCPQDISHLARVHNAGDAKYSRRSNCFNYDLGVPAGTYDNNAVH